MSSSRDGTLFLVDCSTNMFIKPKYEEKTLFEKCMKVFFALYIKKDFLIFKREFKICINKKFTEVIEIILE